MVVHDRGGRIVLVVEPKSRLDVTGDWAARTFRNLYAHGSVPDVPYFMLALPDAFYLWKDPERRALEAFVDGRGGEEVAPDYAVPAWEIVRPYLGGRGVPPHEVSTYAMKMIVGAFVADVLNSDLSRDEAPGHLWWLFDSGLYDAMRGGAFAGTVRS